MKKIISLVTKELVITVRDRTALLLMLAAPVALALVLAAAFGGIGKGSGSSQIPLIIVNQDEGILGANLVRVFSSTQLSSLLAPQEETDAARARTSVDADQTAAAILVPAGLTACVQASTGSCPAIVLYANPGRSVSVGVVRGIIERYNQQVATGALAARVTVTQLVTSGLVNPQQSLDLQKLANQAAGFAVSYELLGIDVQTGAAQANKPFNFLGYYVPAMSVLFLMFSLTNGSRSIHAEREGGTLVRLQAAPIRRSQLVIGKMLSVVVIGLVQMSILQVFTEKVLGVQWGDGVGVTLLIVLTVTAISALGFLIGGLTQTSNQADNIGRIVTMILAALGGNFVIRSAYPAFMQTLSLVGPNAWAITGFQKLAAGATISQLAPELAALGAMTIIFTLLAIWGMRRVLR